MIFWDKRFTWFFVVPLYIAFLSVTSHCHPSLSLHSSNRSRAIKRQSNWLILISLLRCIIKQAGNIRYRHSYGHNWINCWHAIKKAFWSGRNVRMRLKLLFRHQQYLWKFWGWFRLLQIPLKSVRGASGCFSENKAGCRSAKEIIRKINEAIYSAEASENAGGEVAGSYGQHFPDYSLINLIGKKSCRGSIRQSEFRMTSLTNTAGCHPDDGSQRQDFLLECCCWRIFGYSVPRLLESYCMISVVPESGWWSLWTLRNYEIMQ